MFPAIDAGLQQEGNQAPGEDREAGKPAAGGKQYP
jgi:hypothetical protein